MSESLDGKGCRLGWSRVVSVAKVVDDRRGAWRFDGVGVVLCRPAASGEALWAARRGVPIWLCRRGEVDRRRDASYTDMFISLGDKRGLPWVRRRGVSSKVLAVIDVRRWDCPRFSEALMGILEGVRWRACVRELERGVVWPLSWYCKGVAGRDGRPWWLFDGVSFPYLSLAMCQRANEQLGRASIPLSFNHVLRSSARRLTWDRPKSSNVGLSGAASVTSSCLDW